MEIPDTAQMTLCRNTHTNKVVDTGGNVVGEWLEGELVITKEGMELLVDEMQDDMDETTMQMVTEARERRVQKISNPRKR